jgi:hypothetical protein
MSIFLNKLDDDIERKRRRKRHNVENSKQQFSPIFQNSEFQMSDSSCPELEGIECHLETKDLWDKFHSLGTEMIITKTGR